MMGLVVVGAVWIAIYSVLREIARVIQQQHTVGRVVLLGELLDNNLTFYYARYQQGIDEVNVFELFESNLGANVYW